MNEEEKYMARCIQLAKNGLCRVKTNPMVGAVIVHEGRIIGEGYHRKFGEAHAEVNAIRSVADPSLLEQSTIYVSLEPCAHYGKTPPCAELLVKKRIPRVVVGCQDPFPEVAGKGIRMLREAGVDVKVGVLEEECRWLIRKFVTFNTRQRPYVTLKWAESADGYLDVERKGGTAAVLSTSLTSMLVHKRRAESDAIMVGTRTALLDDPSLTVRNWAGENPLRLVVDRCLTLPTSLRLFSDGLPTVCFTEKERQSCGAVEYVRLDFGRNILPQIFSFLYERKKQSLLVEGGARLLQSFIDGGLWDEAFVEKSAVRLHAGVRAPLMEGYDGLSVASRFGVPICHYVREGAF